MTFHSHPAPDDGGDPDEAMAARHSRMLAELADIAMQLARAAGRRALAQADMTEAQAADREGAGQGDLGLAFTRIARCVRQTLALQAKLAQAQRTRAEAVGPRPVWTHADGGAGAVHEKLRRLMMAGLDDDDETEASDPGDREDLLADLHERLDDADAAGRAALPTGEAIVRLRHDLDGFSDAGGQTRAAAAPARPFPAPRSTPVASQPALPGRAFHPP